jgi:phosphoribosyl-ATP pyrophosphohydrolase/phosphoribosyl-AMP cyclohydrolase
VKPEILKSLAWGKGDGLLPVVVQHARSGKVLMLGYMNAEALERTLAGGRAVFYSRSRQRLWTKGETSGHYLDVVQVSADCDADSILVLANPVGATCHKGVESCFAEARPTDGERLAFISQLEATIAQRIAEHPEDSYTARLYGQGPGRIAQKLGEEGVELALAAVSRDDDAVLAESADLLYHLLLLLKARGLSVARVVSELESRHRSRLAANVARATAVP